MEARLAPHNFIGVFDSGVGGMVCLNTLLLKCLTNFMLSDSAFI